MQIVVTLGPPGPQGSVNIAAVPQTEEEKMNPPLPIEVAGMLCSAGANMVAALAQAERNGQEVKGKSSPLVALPTRDQIDAVRRK